MAGAYAPLGTGGGAASGGEPSVWLGATLSSISAMASSDLRIALPTAVRRPVVRLSTTSSRTSWSVVGDWTISANPANATMPIWVVEPWRSMNDEAAASAASRRLGGISVAHMLRETSIARITVVWPAGRLTMLTGRAIAIDEAAEGEDEQGERADGAGCATSAARPRGRATGSSSAARTGGVAGSRCGCATRTGSRPSSSRNPGDRRSVTGAVRARPARRRRRRAGPGPRRRRRAR